jgi:hypothetical protein
MARKVLFDLNYTFTPGGANIGKVVLPRYIPKEKLVLITNVTTNTVIYNFSDPNLKGTVTSVAGQTFPQNTQATLNAGTTTVVLQFNTTSMSSSDKLQILVDEYEETFKPLESLMDPANKMRVSTPQSLIDTDFELGLQPTKWEFFQQQNSQPSVYVRPTDTPLAPIYAGAGIAFINSASLISGNGTTSTITFPVTLATAPAVGSYIYIVDAVGGTTFSTARYTVLTSSTTSATFSSGANGTFTPQVLVLGNVPGTQAYPTYAIFSVANDISVAGANIVNGSPIFVQETNNEQYADGTFFASYVNTSQKAFAFLTKNTVWNSNVLTKAGTTLYAGAFYGNYGQGSGIPVSTIATLTDTRTVYVTCYTAHGLTVGSPIQVLNTTLAAANGSFYVTGVTSETQFYYATYNTVTTSQSQIAQVTTTSNIISTTQLYTRPEGYQLHRAGDGGVQISTGNNLYGAQVIRQTRRYFRYQSGKGIQFSTAATFKPNYDIVTITVSGSLCQITTDQDHGLQPGAVVRFSGIVPNNTADSATYNNTFVVMASQPITSKTFYITLNGTVTDTNPGGTQATVEIVEGKGFVTRLGLFDEQNGFFWEYDGQTLNAVRRNATSVLRGTVNVLTGSSLVIGQNTLFTRQLQPMDKVVVRGQTYLIKAVLSDVATLISPAYRAATPSTAAGTSGLPFATLTAPGSSNTMTFNIINSGTIQTSQVTGTFASDTNYTGASGRYDVKFTFPSATSSTGTAGSGTTGTTGATVFAISATNTSIKAGMLITGTGIPIGTYVGLSYKTGDTTIPCYFTQGATGLSAAVTATTYYFHYVPAPGALVTGGTGIQNNTAVSSILHVTGGNPVNVAVFLNNPFTAQAASTYTIGGVPGPTAANVQQTAQTISLNEVYTLAPGMILAGTGIPGNVSIAAISPIGTGIILNQGLTAAVSNATTIAFSINHGMYATPSSGQGAIQTSASATAGATTLTCNGTYGVTGVQVGSFVTGSANIPLGTYVIAINPATFVITLSAAITGTVASATTLVFGSRIFIANSTSIAVNGQWPVTSVTTSAITFQIPTQPSAGNYWINGQTKIFGEDAVVKKYKVVEFRTPSYQFNMDTIDGTGPTGYNADLTKIQMVYADYTWYGAGFIRWGLRMINGDITYAHKLQHGNTQYQAYMRSGNLPGRFEVSNIGPASDIQANILSTGYTMSPNASGTITVRDASKYLLPFNTTDGSAKNGEVLVDGEYFFYTGLAATVGTTSWGTIATVATVGTVAVAGGSVTSIPVTGNGSGYTAAPPVTIAGGGGGGAQARAVLNGSGGVDRIIVTSGGTGYSSPPTVVVGANQLTGCYRESNIVSIGNFTGTPTVILGSTAITLVSNAASYMVGMTLAASSYFGNYPVTIKGISGTTVYVNTPATANGSGITLTPLQKGTGAVAHYTDNASNIPRTNAVSTVQNMTPSIQHWGVSAIMDGRFDNDKSYVFTTPRQTAAALQPNQTSPLVSIRVSPSVSAGFARNFGVRDIINRMQLNLYQMDVFNSGAFLVTVKYNCNSNIFTPALWNANTVGAGSLSQVIYHNPGDIVTGGDVVVAFYANSSGGTNFTATTSDLTVVKDLGNSVLGGDSVYPDGPDCITVFATNLSASIAQALYSRISWTEAQA